VLEEPDTASAWARQALDAAQAAGPRKPAAGRARKPGAKTR
jgi:hypothetical protein